MLGSRLVAAAALAAGALFVGLPGARAAASTPLVSIVARGLENPRGLKFGPDGNLYVAEGGLGGTQSSVGSCDQVPAVGPYTGGYTGRISRINPWTGMRRTVVDHLPSSQTTAATGGFVSGVADVAFVGDTLYGLEAGAGCSHGLVGTSNDLFRVDRDGGTTPVANLSAFVMSHPVAHPNPDDFEPDGTWYSLVSHDGRLYAVEPNHGEVDVITPRGEVSRLVDVSASQGHIVPTALTFGAGQFYLGNLNVFDPGADGHASVLRLSPRGDLHLVESGLTAVLGVAVHHNQLYALEAFTGFFAPAPAQAQTGSVVRLNRKTSAWETVVSGLSFPTGMTFGPDGNLYVSNKGFGQPTNTSGEIVKIVLNHDDAH